MRPKREASGDQGIWLAQAVQTAPDSVKFQGWLVIYLELFRKRG